MTVKIIIGESMINIQKVLVLVFLCAFLGLYAQTITPIAVIQENITLFVGQIVTIEGVVTIGANTTYADRLNAYLQDDSEKGILIYDNTLDPAYIVDFQRGQKLQIIGTIKYNTANQTEQSIMMTEFSYSIIASGNPIPYLPLSIIQAREFNVWKDTMVQLRATISSISSSGTGVEQGYNVIIGDDSYENFTMRILTHTGINVDSLKPGTEIIAKGIIRRPPNASTQLLPAYQDDLTMLNSPIVIENIIVTPPNPMSFEDITITAKIYQENGMITNAQIEYHPNLQSNFKIIQMNGETNNIYTALIPKFNQEQNESGYYIFRITATDAEGKTISSPERSIPIQYITPIALIHNNFSQYNGQLATIEGIITIGAGTTHGTQLNAYIQDESERGLMVYGNPTMLANYAQDFQPGIRLRLTGTINDNNGIHQIINWTLLVISENNPVPIIPMTVTEARNYQKWQSTMVKISGSLTENPAYAGTGYNVTIRQNNATITVRVWDSTGIEVSRLKAGMLVDVEAVVSIFNNASQVLPGYQHNIFVHITNPVIETMTFTPRRPYIDEEITVTSTIYDYNYPLNDVVLAFRTQSQTNYTEVLMTKLNNDLYSAQIPAFNTIQENDGSYYFKISATNSVNIQTNSAEKIIMTYSLRPIIEKIEVKNHPEAGEPLIIWAKITDREGVVEKAEVRYRLNFEKKEISHPLLPLENEIDTYEAEIRGYSSGTVVFISIWAINNLGHTSQENLDDQDHEVKYVFPVKKSAAMLKIKPQAYNIFAGEKAEIGFFAKEGDLVIMRIYNSEGKLVHTPINSITSTVDGINYYFWDGKNKDFKMVEPGLYICYLEVLDRVSGKKKNDKAPIVIGTRLK